MNKELKTHTLFGGDYSRVHSPRYLVLVSESSPVTISNSVLNNTPFLSPMYRYKRPLVLGTPSPASVPPISTIASESGDSGSACKARGCRQSDGSKLIIRTVSSRSPIELGLHSQLLK